MKITFALLFIFICNFSLQAQISISSAFVDNKINPTGISPNKLFFSWEMTSASKNEIQQAYQIVISSSINNLENNNFDIYDSKKVNSSESIQVYPTRIALSAGTIYYWKVRVWNKQNKVSSWSLNQKFITGIFNSEDWKESAWIGMEDMAEESRVVPFVHYKMKEEDPRIQKNAASPYLRKTFEVSKKVKSALLFISGLGHYEASLNGQNIGKSFLSPGWTNYDKTVLYNTYDITADLKPGKNALGVILGNGFYHVSQERYTKGTGYFCTPKLIALLKVEYTDNSSSYIITDQSWKTNPSPTVFNNIYGGEDYDARLIQENWNHPSFDDSQWKAALLTNIPRGSLKPEIDYPVSLVDTLVPQTAKKLNANTIVYDFGQNLSGIPSIKIKGKPGQKIKIIPAESLTADGLVNQSDGVSPHFYEYTLGSEEEELWHPKFTYFAVRYIQVEGVSLADLDTDHPKLLDISLLHNSNTAPLNGSFSCSDSIMNNIYSIIDRAIKSNIQSYITDNPQREKLSWQGEQNFMRNSINYNYNMYNMYRSLIRNLKDAQHGNGLIPDVAPEYVQFSGPFVDSPEWGTTGILNMWFMYKFYGDPTIIRNNFQMMKDYANYLSSKSKGNLLLYGLGDWLDVGNVTPMGLTASAYYYKSIKALAEMSLIINDQASAKTYAALANKIKASFNATYFNKDKFIYGSGSQTSLSMPLSVGLVPESYHNQVLQNLVNQVKDVDQYAITAGDVGNKFLINTLFMNGYSDILYDMLQKGDTPGYRYQLNKGVTALAETWDGKMSQNQLAMGHILEWYYEGILGIRQEEESIGFKRIIIAPQLVSKLNSAQGYFHSPYGKISSEWVKKGNSYEFKLSIPVNTSAKVVLPSSIGSNISLNSQKINLVKKEMDNHILTIGSGDYLIVVEN